MNTQTLSTVEVPRCLSWRAVFAGVIGALGLHLLLSLIASGLGLATFDPLTDSEPVKKFGTGAMIGWSLCALVSLYCGGWIAGRFNDGNKLTGGLHGFLVWSVAMIAVFGLLAAGSGLVLGGLAKAVTAGAKGGGTAVGGLANLAKESAQRNHDQVKSFIDEAMGSRSGNSPTNETIRAKRELGFAVTRVFASGNDIDSAENRAALKKALTQYGNLSDSDTDKLIAEWADSYKELKNDVETLKASAEEKTRKAADVAARRLSKAAFCSFFAFWIGAMVASVGGVCGSKCAYREIRLVREEV